MRRVALLLNGLLDEGVIQDYALFGALAQMRYTEPVATFDADVLVGVPAPERLDVRAPIYTACATRGYQPDGEAIRVGAWPVQFVPAVDDLTREAMRRAESVDFEGVPLRVVRADYLAVIALSVGRAKDSARIVALLDAGSVTPREVESLAVEHGLGEAWRRFEARFLGG